VGTIFALQAKSKWSDADDRCPDKTCSDKEAVGLADDAKSAGNIATIGFGVGLVGLATGAVLWLTAPSSKERASAWNVTSVVGPRHGSVVVRGAF